MNDWPTSDPYCELCVDVVREEFNLLSESTTVVLHYINLLPLSTVNTVLVGVNSNCGHDGVISSISFNLM